MACPSRIWPYVIVPDEYPNIMAILCVVDMVAGYCSSVYLINLGHEFKPLYEFFFLPCPIIFVARWLHE